MKTAFFTSKPLAITIEDELKEKIQLSLKEMLTKIGKWLSEDSGWTVDEVDSLKWYYDQKNCSFFPLDFKTMLTKHQLTQALSSDFKKTPVYFNCNFLIYWSAITNFNFFRELGRGENDVKHSLV